MEDSNPKSSKKQHEEFSERQDGANATAAVEYGDFACSKTDFRCLQCAVLFTNNETYALHNKSNGHAIMGLVTGLTYVGQDKMPRQFPELYRCVLCDIFHLTLVEHVRHLLCKMHTELVKYVRNISFWTETILVGMECENKEPRSFQDLGNLKHSPSNYCQLCDKQCENAETFKNHTEEPMHKSLLEEVISCKICNLSYVRFDYYERHLNSLLHAKLKNFMGKMSIPENEISRTPEKIIHISQTMEVNKHYFCKLCNIKFDSVVSFRKHRSIPIHRNMQQLVQLMSSVRNGVHHCGGTYEESFPYMHYCDLCNVFLEISSPEMYENHLKNRIHMLFVK